MKIKYTANVIKCDGVIVAVEGSIDTDKCGVGKKDEFSLYNIQCCILFDNFKPGEAAGPSNVTITDMLITV